MAEINYRLSKFQGAKTIINYDSQLSLYRNFKAKKQIKFKFRQAKIYLFLPFKVCGSNLLVYLLLLFR